MSGDLVAKPVDETKWYSGISQLEDAKEVKDAVESGDWMEAGIGAVTLGADVAMCLTDPTAALGMVIEAAVGWIMEHLEPLKEALDKLAGNPEVVKSFGQTWQNVADRLNTVAEDYTADVNNDLTEWAGAAADAYRAASTDRADALRTTAETCAGVSSAVMMAGEVVAAVRIMVRDLIAALVSGLIEAVLPPGPGTARAAVKLIRNVLQKVVKVIGKLVRSLSKLASKLPKLIKLLADVAKRLKPRRSGGGSPPTTKPRVDQNAPTTHKPDGTTTSSSDQTTTSLAPDTRTPPDTRNPPDSTSTSSSTTPSSTISPDTGRPNTTKTDTTSPSSTKTDTTPTRPSTKDSDTPRTSTLPNKTETSPSRPDKPNDSRTPESERRCKSDPIDVASGEMVFGQVDVELPGVLPLVLRRTHVSTYRAGRSFGPSWASTLDQRIEGDSLGLVFVAGDGMRLVYPRPDAEPVLPEVGPRLPLHRIEHGYAITDPATGTTWRFTANAGATLPLTSITHRTGDRIDFGRDDNGTLVEIRHSGGYRVKVESADGLITALWLANAEPDVPLVRFTYNAERRLTEVINSSGFAMRFDYDGDGRVTGWQDRNGSWYRYVYDEQGRCVRNVGSGGFLDGTFTYRDHETVFTDSLGHSTTYHLNELKQIVREVDPLGGVTTTHYDKYDRVLSTTDPLGRTTRRAYDDAGNLVEVVRPDGSRSLAEFNKFRQPTKIVAPDGSAWHWEYDEHGNLSTATNPLGGVTRYRYDERGHLAAVVDAAGGTRRVESDAVGLPIAVTTAGGIATRYGRDVFGRVVSITDPAGGVTRLAWTIEGQIAGRTLPDGATERWRYDGEGNVVEHVDALGQATRVEYTHFDLPIAEIAPDGSRLEFHHDNNLRLLAVTNANGDNWSYRYDPAGRLVSETDFTGRQVSYVNDACGQLVERRNGAGEITRFTRDVLGRVIERHSGDVVTTFRHDAAGRMAHARNDDAELLFERDAAGRVLVEQVNGRAIVSTYDVLGRRTGRRTPSGMDSRWRYGADGEPVELHSAGRTVSFGYDVAGREIEQRFGAMALNQTWDTNHRLRTQTVVGTEDRLVQRRAYNYRADGHVSTVVDQLSGPREYDLDAIGRITTVRGTGWREHYAYDPAGNIVSAGWPADSDAEGSREYAAGVLRRAGRIYYEHDAEGRVVLRSHQTLSGKRRTWRYTWNGEGRLIGVITPDGQRWEYRYDPLGRRITKLCRDGDAIVAQIDFVWDGPVLAEQTHSSGHTTAWEWQPGTFRAVAQAELKNASQQWIDAQFYAIVADVVGTPTELVTSDGMVAWHSRPTVWGAAVPAPRAQAHCPLRFPGQYHDPETGLHYNHHRYYDPETGRYRSSDPLGLSPAPNPYTYVFNPMGWIDPLGLAKNKCLDNLDFPSRQDALDAAYDRAGIPRGHEPDARWEVGDDPTRRNEPGYRFTEDRGSHGHYMQFETENGSRVIAEHTNDPNHRDGSGQIKPHFHAGQPGGDPSRDGVNFGWDKKSEDERYKQVGNKHHFFYPRGR